MSASLVSSMMSETQSYSTHYPPVNLTFADRAIDSHSIWSTNGGPPLILVLLATGLLVAALIALFVLRRIYLGRDISHSQIDVYRRFCSYFEDDRPQLWDVQLASTAITYEFSWKDITVSLHQRFMRDDIHFKTATICKSDIICCRTL